MVDKENVSINKTIKQTLINSLIKRKNTKKKQKDGLKRRNKMKRKGEEIKERIKAKNNKKKDISKWDKPVSTKPHLQEQSRKVLRGIKQ